MKNWLWNGSGIRTLNYLIGKLANCTIPLVKNILIRKLITYYQLDLRENVWQDPAAYPSFNSFFTRALRCGSRPQPSKKNIVSSPVDGVIYGAGQLSNEILLEIKGRKFDVAQLLGDRQVANYYRFGEFALIYLAPDNYHRVHFPLDGRLVTMRYLPGSLYSVNPESHVEIPDLIARNERVVITFQTVLGLVTLVLVGAALVGSIETIWQGIVNDDKGRIKNWNYDKQRLVFERGDELGRFRYGSSVVLLLPSDKWHWEDWRNRLPQKIQVGNAMLKQGSAD